MDLNRYQGVAQSAADLPAAPAPKLPSFVLERFGSPTRVVLAEMAEALPRGVSVLERPYEQPRICGIYSHRIDSWTQDLVFAGTDRSTGSFWDLAQLKPSAAS